MYFEQTRLLDAQSLFTGTISNTGVFGPYDTTSFQSIALELSGSGIISGYIQISNDQVTWYQINVNSLLLAKPVSTITNQDLYSFRTSAKYMQLVVVSYSGSWNVAIIGRSGIGPEPSDTIAAAFSNSSPLYVSNNPLNSSVLQIQDIGKVDGQNKDELLTLMLLELKILNQYMYEMITGRSIRGIDAPESFRLEQSIFNQ